MYPKRQKIFCEKKLEALMGSTAPAYKSSRWSVFQVLVKYEAVKNPGENPTMMSQWCSERKINFIFIVAVYQPQL